MAAQTGDVIRVSVIHDNSVSGEQVNQYQFKLSAGGPVDESDLLDDIAVIIKTIYTLVVGIISIRNVLREVTVYNLTQSLLVGSTDADTYVGGTLTGDDVPQGCAPYVYFKTNVPRVILSKYLPSTTAAAIDLDGGLTAGALASLSAFGVSLLGDYAVGGHTYQYGYLSGKTFQFELPDLKVASDLLAYQRRRKVGRGS